VLRPFVGPASLNDPPYGLRRTMLTVAERRLTPHVPPPRLLRRLPAPPQFDLVAVYRSRNAPHICSLVQEVTGTASLWALDDAPDPLLPITTGSGRGTRFANLNRLVTALDPQRWLVVADDDVVLTSGTLRQCVSLARTAGLDIAMPTHDCASFVNWESTRCRLASLVRLSRFVDQGPLLVLSPAGRRAILPFSEDLGMGWGAELAWACDDSLRIGLLDAIRMRHLAPVSRTSYDVDAEWARAADLLDRSQWASWREVQAEQDRWRRGRRRPPWPAGPDGS
jgi:hypothetical protein